MDFPSFLVVPMTALIAAMAVVIMSAAPRRRIMCWFLIAVGLLMLLGVLLMQPWRILALNDLAMLPLGFGLIAIWAVFGYLIDGAPALLKVRGVTLVRQRN